MSRKRLLELMEQDQNGPTRDFFGETVHDMLVDNLYRLMGTLTDSALVANHRLSKSIKTGETLKTASGHFSGAVISPHDIFFDMTAKIVLSNGKEGFALRIRNSGNNQEIPTLYVCVGQDDKIYASIFDANSLNDQFEADYELDFQEIPVNKIEKVVTGWVMQHLSAEHIVAMKQDAFWMDLQDTRGVRHTLASRDFGQRDVDVWKAQVSGLAKELNQALIGSTEGQVYDLLLKTAEDRLQKRLSISGHPKVSL